MLMFNFRGDRGRRALGGKVAMNGFEIKVIFVLGCYSCCSNSCDPIPLQTSYFQCKASKRCCHKEESSY